MPFSGNIVVIGFGSVSQCFIPLLIKYFQILPKQITVIDAQKLNEKVKDLGVAFYQNTIDKNNYQAVLSGHLRQGDLLIDLGLTIDTIDVLTWCNQTGIHFLNTALNCWDGTFFPTIEQSYQGLAKPTFCKVKELQNKLDKKGLTSIVMHGANPGLSAHFAKKALTDFAHSKINSHIKNKKDIEDALADQNFALLAQLLGVKVIHIAEWDMHSTKIPKKIGEFINTWSPFALIQECLELCQIGRGTHEKKLNHLKVNNVMPYNYVSLPFMSMQTWLHSWVPQGPIIGMAVSHEDVTELCSHLCLMDDSGISYAPTIAYVYRPYEGAIISLQELAMRQLHPPEHYRVIFEKVTGKNQLGVLLMGDLGSWWTGSLLDMETVNAIAPGQNACTLQVAAGMIAAFDYIANHKNEGTKFPFQLPTDQLLSTAASYLGFIHSDGLDWSPAETANRLRAYNQEQIEIADQWQFETFLYNPTLWHS